MRNAARDTSIRVEGFFMGKFQNVNCSTIILNFEIFRSRIELED
jgi:hypothetical protein